MDTIEPDFIETETGNGYGSTLSTSARGTLDESIVSTFKRDFHEINDKLKKVVYPHFPLGSPSAQDQHVFQGTDPVSYTHLDVYKRQTILHPG